MPRKVFTAGEILTAANLNDVSDATVMVFDDATARTTAIPTPVEGMVTYLEDVGGAQGLEVFDGAVFTPVAIEPDPPAILQVVSSTKTDSFSGAGNIDHTVPDLSVSITPSSTSSKVLIIVALSLSAANTTTACQGNLLENSTVIGGDAVGNRPSGTFYANRTGDARDGFTPTSFTHLSSPATVSALTYSVQVRGDGTVTVNRSGDDVDLAIRPRTVSSITVMEVAG